MVCIANLLLHVTIAMSAITNYFMLSCDKSDAVTKKIPTTKQKSRVDRLQNSKFKPEWSKIFPSIQSCIAQTAKTLGYPIHLR